MPFVFQAQWAAKGGIVLEKQKQQEGNKCPFYDFGEASKKCPFYNTNLVETTTFLVDRVGGYTSRVGNVKKRAGS